MDISGLMGSYFDTATSGVSQSGNKISQMTEEEIKQKSDDELMEVCKEFESYFLEQVFKEMAKSVEIFKGDDKDDSTSKMVDFFKENTIAELASQSTDKNSLGLAQMLYEQMKRNYNL